MTRFSPTMTANTLPVPFVISASSYYNFAEFVPFHAMDGLTSYWLTNSTATGWFQLDIGSGNSEILYEYNIKVNIIPEPNRAPKDWTIQGSDTGVFSGEEDVLDTVTDETGWGLGESRNYQCDTTTTAYRYFRIDMTANNGDSYLQLCEWELYNSDIALLPIHQKRITNHTNLRR